MSSSQTSNFSAPDADVEQQVQQVPELDAEEQHKLNVSASSVKAVRSTNKESKATDKQFSSKDWNRIEKPIKPYNKQILLTLKDQATGNINVEQGDFVIMGDSLFKLIAPTINGHIPLIPNSVLGIEEAVAASSGDKKGKKAKVAESAKPAESPKDSSAKKEKKVKEIKMSKADQIRQEQSLGKVKESITRIMTSFKKDSLTPGIGFAEKMLELRGLAFMYCAWFITQNPKIYNTNKNIRDVYDLIFGIQKFYNSVKSYKGKSLVNQSTTGNISETMINSLNYWCAELTKKHPIDGLEITKVLPELLVYTSYDTYVPHGGIKMRSHQVDLLNTIMANMMSGFLITYTAMIGAGKTSFSAVALTALAMKERMSAKASGKTSTLTILFICNLASVRDDAAGAAYHAHIPFAIAYDRKGSPKIVNHFFCKNDTDVVLIVTGPETGLQLIKKDQERCEIERRVGGTPDEKYVVFIDEPTVGADQYGSDALNKNVMLLTNMTKRVVLASATMPEIKTMPDIIENHKKKYPDVYIGNVYSNEIQIACEVKTFDNDIIVPHLKCKTSAELKERIDMITKNPPFGRMYTASVVSAMWYDMYKSVADKSILPDIRTYLSSAENLTSDNIRKIAMQMLEILATQSDSIITSVCAAKFSDVPEVGKSQSKIDDDSGISWEEEAKDDRLEDTPTYQYSKLPLSQASRFSNQTLLATPDPVEFCKKEFKNYIDIMHKEGVNADEILERYNKAMEIHKAKIARLEIDIKDEELRSKKEQELDSHEKPAISFPPKFQINSQEHIKTFAPTKVTFQRPVVDLITMPLESRVPENIMLLAFAGIGIYAPGSDFLDEEYTDWVMTAASLGQLAFVIANVSIAYGTNKPFTAVIVTKEFSDQHSMATILQLSGRAGRVGKSYKALVLVPNQVANRIVDYMIDPSKDLGQSEGKNMNDTFLAMRKHDQERLETEYQSELRHQEEEERARLQKIMVQEMLAQKLKEKAESEKLNAAKPSKLPSSWDDSDDEDSAKPQQTASKPRNQYQDKPSAYVPSTRHPVHSERESYPARSTGFNANANRERESYPARSTGFNANANRERESYPARSTGFDANRDRDSFSRRPVEPRNQSEDPYVSISRVKYEEDQPKSDVDDWRRGRGSANASAASSGPAPAAKTKYVPPAMRKDTKPAAGKSNNPFGDLSDNDD
jgi:hypothetical protein